MLLLQYFVASIMASFMYEPAFMAGLSVAVVLVALLLLVVIELLFFKRTN
ncbi:hypothetical protein L4Z68_002396 [Pseudomonas aeruginosa]|nr:hypothetical protein [Pseudomonas aeruginosa]EKX2970380.1 hypothetical protein [Pseudomonas aeruginosa]